MNSHYPQLPSGRQFTCLPAMQFAEAHDAVPPQHTFPVPSRQALSHTVEQQLWKLVCETVIYYRLTHLPLMQFPDAHEVVPPQHTFPMSRHTPSHNVDSQQYLSNQRRIDHMSM